MKRKDKDQVKKFVDRILITIIWLFFLIITIWFYSKPEEKPSQAILIKEGSKELPRYAKSHTTIN